MKTITKFLPSYVLLRHFLASASLVVAGLLAAQPVSADINSVTTSPAALTTPVTNSYTANITWTVNRTETDPTGGPYIRPVSSGAATLFINGVNAGLIAGSISKNSSSLIAFQTETVSLTETITFSAAQLKQIATSPAGSVSIVRAFTDTQTTSNATLNIFAGSANAQDITVRRIELSFQNRSTTDVVSLNEPLHAIADVSFASSGVIQGEWRLIDPTTTLGSQAGRVLQVVRHSVVSSGQGRTQIVSPTLPTGRSGLYMLAFAVEQDDNPIEIPILRYFVVDDGSDTAALPMTTFSPAEEAEIDTNTVFAWAAVNGAAAYQVDIFIKDDNVPLTGKLVPATELQLKLSAMSLDWLAPATEYFWQVKALGGEGETLAISPKQIIVSP